MKFNRCVEETWATADKLMDNTLNTPIVDDENDSDNYYDGGNSTDNSGTNNSSSDDPHSVFFLATFAITYKIGT